MAHGLNADLLNQLVQGSAVVNELLNNRLQQRNTKLSQVSKLTSSKGTENPFSCDPLTLQDLGASADLWPACAGLAKVSGNSEEKTLVPNAAAAANSLEIMQRNAQ